MKKELQDLLELRSHPGFIVLQAAWAGQGKKIMDSLNKAAKLSGKDSNLRYYAGEWSGFDLAIGQLDRAIEDLERQIRNQKEAIDPDELLRQIREGDPK